MPAKTKGKPVDGCFPDDPDCRMGSLSVERVGRDAQVEDLKAAVLAVDRCDWASDEEVAAVFSRYAV